MENSLPAVLGLAFGLGMVHALDADHIAAVSGLACREQPRRHQALRFCLQWAGGHGLVLLLIGAAVLLLGAAIPASLSHLAENLVGVVLIGIGTGVFLDIRRQRLSLQGHRHADLPAHVHWQGGDQAPGRHNHSPLLVGVLHGTAGSAPLFALLPLATQQPWHGMLYLLLFDGGVLLSMLLFGGLVEWLVTRLLNRMKGAVDALRTAVAFASIALGGWLLHGLL